MTAYIQSGSFQTKQALVGPGDNIAIDINGNHHPVKFISNGGTKKAHFEGPTLVLENFNDPLGTGVQFQFPVGEVTKKLTILVVSIGEPGAAYTMITWSLY